ncbi:hypothetical protein GPECTOR_47g401 [Gonium pectorale]|uniref:HYR domain-containing protein n=1 Tax=Gonium pectorale TaxID=33097 RepID=A0A150G8N4_GONPE|nr:hypothetical protein GPECTOR_47g401 [Gonium pectorale]|eukprot:KXZ46123.1 hypothetical protein GPECTOR_47g401 [Gonium pectorale]
MTSFSYPVHQSNLLRGSYSTTRMDFGVETCAKVAAKPDVCGLLSPCGEAGSFTSCTPGTENGKPSWTSWSCTCAAGFYFDATLKKCSAANCATGSQPCGTGGTCTNINSMAYNCTCKRAFFFDPQSKTCLGTCKPGYFFDALGTKICQRNPCFDPAVCGGPDKAASCNPFNSTTYTCTCKSGFYFDAVTKTCKADLCAAAQSPCGPSEAFSKCALSATSATEVLGYKCTCRPGFNFQDGTCVRGSDASGACANSPCGDAAAFSRCTPMGSVTPSYVCACNTPAYLFDGTEGKCLANPCTKDGASPCGAAGTFTSCVPKSSTGYTCACAPGYFFNGVTCQGNLMADNDFTCNSCIGATNPCGNSTDATCAPTSGTDYSCGCPTGQAFDQLAKRCVADTTPPVVTVPTGIVVEAADALGAIVLYTVTASDVQSPGPLTPTCNPPSGSKFAITGSGVGQQVVCTASDSAKNTVTKSFRVRVVDTKPPSLEPIANMIQESSDPIGMTIDFSSKLVYSDLVSGATVACDGPANNFFEVGEPTKGTCTTSGGTTADGTATCVQSTDGSLAAIESTVVTCTATDGYGNKAVQSFTVTVVKPTPPLFTSLVDVVVDAEDANGATVVYALPTAIDAMSPTNKDTGAATVTCFPASGNKFAIGITVIACTAADSLGMKSTATFTITVTCTWTSPLISGTAPSSAITPFDETTAASGGLYPISKVSITAGDFLNGIAVTYSGSKAAAMWRGAVGGSLGLSELGLEAGESITGVVVGYGSYISAIGLNTNRRSVRYLAGNTFVEGTTTSSSAGTPSTAPTCAPAGSRARLIAVKGSSVTTGSGVRLQSLAFVWSWDAAATLIVPDDITVEAPTPDGVAVSYTVVATNDADFSCNPPSGSTFTVKKTTVTCQIAGGGASDTFAVTVAPPTPPVFVPSVLPGVPVTATTPNGALVEFPAFTVTDALSGPPMVVCEPPSNSFFAIGTTEVKCTAVDRLQLSATATFNVVVARNSKFADPTLALPADMTYEGIKDAATRSITYTVTPSVNVPFTCSPPSGSPFEVGKTTAVTCSVDGYAASSSFKVTIAAPAPPVFSEVPADVFVQSNTRLGAVVEFTVSATDALSGISSLECQPPSGFTFPLGVSSVTCTATDGVGQQASATFKVTVNSPCSSPVSPCGGDGAYTSCRNIGSYDFACACAIGYTQDGTGACTSVLQQATTILTSAASVNQCLDATDGKCRPPAGSLLQQPCTRTAYQSFTFVPTWGGAYAVCSSAFGNARCVQAASAGDVTLAASDPQGAPDQRFYARPVNSTGYTLSPVQQPTKCLAVEGASDLGGAKVVLASCPTSSRLVPKEQLFVLPVDTGICEQGLNRESLEGFKAAFKDIVADVWSTPGVPITKSQVNILGSTVQGVAVDFSDAVDYRRHRRVLLQEGVRGQVPVQLRFAVTWPIAAYPPDEAPLAEVLSATVTAHVDTVKPVISAASSSLVVSDFAPLAVTLPVVTASDDFYVSAPLSCDPPSGSLFAAGTTNVVCKALDGSGNYEIATIPVVVTGCPAGKYLLSGQCYADPCANNPCATTYAPGAMCSFAKDASSAYSCTCPTGTSLLTPPGLRMACYACPDVAGYTVYMGADAAGSGDNAGAILDPGPKCSADPTCMGFNIGLRANYSAGWLKDTKQVTASVHSNLCFYIKKTGA